MGKRKKQEQDTNSESDIKKEKYLDSLSSIIPDGYLKTGDLYILRKLLFICDREQNVQNNFIHKPLVEFLTFFDPDYYVLFNPKQYGPSLDKNQDISGIIPLIKISSNNIFQDLKLFLKPFQIIRVCRKFSRIIKFFYQLSQTKVIHISGFLLKEGEKVILNKIQKINSEEMQNYINMFIKEGVEIKIDKNKLDDFFNQYIDSLPKNKHYKCFQSRCRFVGDKITEKFLIYYLDNEKKLDREEIYITYKSLKGRKQIFVINNPEDFYIDPNKDDSHLWDSEPRFCIIETLFQMERNRKIKILEMEPEGFHLECLNLEDLNITEEQKVKQYSNVEVVRKIEYDEKKGKFKIIENGKTIKEFPLGGYKELILKVLVNAKTPLTKNEIVKKSGKEEIKSFSTYISRLNKKPLKQLGLKIICENNKYSPPPIK